MKKAMAIILLLVGVVLAILSYIKYENYRLTSPNEAFSEAMPFGLGSGALIIVSIVLLILSRKKEAA
jgi:Na+-transporting NADH:ubiquinone oxidoreductase subunit NqrE